MANPFDQFDPQASSNPFDQFDQTTSTSGAGPAVKPALQSTSGTEVGQGLQSAADAGLSMVAGLPSMIAGGLMGLGTLATTGDIDKAANTSQKIQESNFGLGAPKPFTKGGQEALQNISEGTEKMAGKAGDLGYKIGGEAGRANAEFATNALLNLLGGEGGLDAATAHAAITHPDVVAGKKTLTDQIADIQKKQADAEALQQKGPQLQGQGDLLNDVDTAGRGQNQFGVNPDQWKTDENGMPHDPNLSLDAQQMETPTQKDMFNDPNKPLIPQPETPNMRSPEIDEALRQQQNQEILEHLQRLDDTASGIEDYNAHYANQDLIEKLKELEARRGEEPIYVDTQGQAFRGDPNETGARAGLDAQTDAMDRELTHLRGQGTPEGEPLRPLQDHEMNDAKAAAGEALREMQEKEKQSGMNFKEKPISSKGKMGRQRGAIDLGGIKDAADRFKKGLIGAKEYLQSWKGAFDPRAMETLEHGVNGDLTGKRVEFLSPREFHTVANLRGKEALDDAPRLREKIRGALESDRGLFEHPELWTETKGGISKVTEHEGRNRMDVFREMGLDKVPTLIHDTSIDGSKPTHLQAQWTDNNFARVPLKDRPISSIGKFNKQRGAVDFGLGNLLRKTGMDKDAERFANGQKQRYGSIPTDRPVEETIKQARGESDGKGWNYTEAGGILTAMKRDSTAIRDAVRTVQNAEKRGDWQINQFIHPVERSVKGLSASDRSLLWHGVLKKELLENKKYDPAVLKTLPNRVQEAYAHFRRMFDDTLNIQNQQRRAEGKPEITPLEAYVASRWSGDYRRPIFQAVLDKAGNPVLDSEGNIQRKLVWYLAGDSKFDLNRQTKALLKQFPDLMHDPDRDHIAPGYLRKTDMQSAYTRALDILGRDDPAVQKLKEAAEAEMVNQSANFLNQSKHFEPKAGIRGFVGDRPGKEGRTWYGADKANKEALAGLQQQINYGKNAYRWAEIQKAGEGIKQIVNDPVLAKEQPNNIKYIREYYKNALGFGQNAALAALTQSINHGLGFNPRAIAGIVSNSKSFFILQKLALNAKTSIMHMLQSANVFPHLTNVWTKEGGHDPVTSYAVGFPAGMALATKHYADFLAGKGPGDVLSPADRGFFQRAFKYAEDNMVTTHTIYQEAPIEKTTGVLAQTGRAMGHALGIPETISRSVAFMSLVHALRGSEKFKGNEQALFQKAEELTYAAMGDYRSQERALAFHKAGAVGNALNTLQTYPVNQIQQYNYFARQAIKGNVAPLATLIAVQYAMAGIMGLPGMDDLDKLYRFTKDHILSDSLYVKAQSSEFWSDPILWMLHHWGTDTVDGWISAKTGLGISSSLRSAMPSDMARAPGAPYLDMASQMWNIGKAAGQPVADGGLPFSNKTLNAQVAMSSLPSGALQGNFEESKMMEGTTWNKKIDPQTGKEVHVYERPANLMSHTGVSERDPHEEMLRRFGLRSERETMEREIGYRLNESTQVAKDRADGPGGVTDRFYDAIRRGDKQTASDLFKVHVELTGEPISDSAIQERMLREMTTGVERAGMAAKTVTQITNAARMKQLIDQVKKEQGYGNK